MFRRRRPPAVTGLGTDFERMVEASKRPEPKPGRWQRIADFLIPSWLAVPLTFLGTVFLFFKPVGASWNLYGLAVGVAVFFAFVMRRRSRHLVLHREADGLLVWIARGRNARQAEPPSVVIRGRVVDRRVNDLLQRQLISHDEYERLRTPPTKGSSGQAPTTKACPDCAESVLAAARVCRYCGYRFDDLPESETSGAP